MTDMQPPKNIVLAVDGGNQQPSAIALAAGLTHTTGASLTVVNVYPYGPTARRLGNAYELTVREDAEAILADASARLSGIDHTTRAVADISTPKALHAVCDDLGADLLVVGSCHRGSIGRAMLGGTADRLLHGAPCPVAIAPRDFASSDGPASIGVGVDGSDEGDAALAWAASLAQAASAELVIIGVAEPLIIAAGAGGVVFPYEEVMAGVRVDVEEQLERARQSVADRVPATVKLLEGPPAVRLAEAAEQLDMLVVGSRGYGPIRTAMVGSVARSLAHHAPCPLVLLPRTAVAGETSAEASAASTVLL